MTQRRTQPNVVSIPPGTGFLDCLAARLLDGTLLSGPGHRPAPPGDLADATVWLPNRRAARVLTSRLLARAKGPLILPRIAAIGDVDEDRALVEAINETGSAQRDTAFDDDGTLPPAVSALERHLALTRLVHEFGISQARALNYPGRSDGLLIPVGPADASALARDLARLLDSFQTEGIAPSRLQGLVTDDLAAYWDISYRFLTIVADAWPGHLAERDRSDPIARRNALISAHADRLRIRQPDHPLIIAGSTGSVPATAELMKAVAHLPRGWIVLPGLDRDLDDGAWESLGDAASQVQTHPQFGLAQLLARLGLGRDDVDDLNSPDASPTGSRSRLIAEVFRPADTTELWHTNANIPSADACDGLSLIIAATPREEALAIALALRDGVESGKGNAALVTPDRALARRVSSELARWDLQVDDSAGRPLSSSSAGTFLRLVLDVAAEEFAPVALSSMLRHPLFGGRERPFIDAIDALEAMVLRGPRPAPGMDGLRTATMAALTVTRLRNGVASRLRARSGEQVIGLVDLVDTALEPLCRLRGADANLRFTYIVSALRDAAIALSGGHDEDGSAHLFSGDDGVMLERFLDGIISSFDTGMTLPLAACPAFIASLMEGVPVRAAASDPRIAILGPLEARLQTFGRVVLGGLNEGTWPGDARTDPWLSRSMRGELGLDLPERRIGLAAHDVAQHMAAEDVVLSRALRQDGSHSVASRWLQRLEAVIGKPQYDVLVAAGSRYVGWARALDHATQGTLPSEPRPCPPRVNRPRRLSVTQAERLARDPYAIYAAKVLHLDPLPPLDDSADAALRGTLVHAALARYVRDHRDATVETAAKIITELFETEMERNAIAPHMRSLWRPRLERIAHWFARFEHDRRNAGHQVAGLEVDGHILFETTGGSFELTARADRIDLRADGSLGVIDYKTGAPPTVKQVKSGLALQLTLEAAIAAQGGFDGIDALPPGELLYLRLSGGDPPGELKPVSQGDAVELAQAGLQQFIRIIARLDDPSMPYRPRVAAHMLRDEEPFDHLSRFAEWSTADGGEDGA